MHELRHYWQYVNLENEFMYWCNPIRSFDAKNNPLEIDAWNYCGMDVRDPSKNVKSINRTLSGEWKFAAIKKMFSYGVLMPKK